MSIAFKKLTGLTGYRLGLLSIMLLYAVKTMLVSGHCWTIVTPPPLPSTHAHTNNAGTLRYCLLIIFARCNSRLCVFFVTRVFFNSGRRVQGVVRHPFHITSERDVCGCGCRGDPGRVRTSCVCARTNSAGTLRFCFQNEFAPCNSYLCC